MAFYVNRNISEIFIFILHVNNLYWEYCLFRKEDKKPEYFVHVNTVNFTGKSNLDIVLINNVGGGHGKVTCNSEFPVRKSGIST